MDTQDTNVALCPNCQTPILNGVCPKCSAPAEGMNSGAPMASETPSTPTGDTPQA